MIVKCNNCSMYFDDEFRSTICPHETFPANDGLNNFEIHEDAYLSDEPLTGKNDWTTLIFERN